MPAGLSVLWAADGSECAIAGAALIRDLVLPVAASVRILTVVPDPVASGAHSRTSPLKAWSRKQKGDARDRASLVGKSCAELLPDFGGKVESETRFGHPVQEILRTAVRGKVDLIVLGAKGQTDLKLMRMGSVAQGVLEYARRPVLMVRPSTKGDTARMDTAIIGIDGSKSALKALEFFESLALNPGTVRVIARVVQMVTRRPEFEVDDEHFADVVSKINEGVRRGAQQDIVAALDLMPSRSRAEAINEVFIGRPEEELLKAAAQWQADIIVVGSRVPSRTRKYPISSTAETIAREAISSVLVVR
jgi:nucleotide-binding universal stress UspA family protein